MFASLCSTFDRMKSKKTKADKLREWSQFYSSFNDGSLNVNVYNMVRLVLPKLDAARSSYGLKENALARKYIDALCISKGSIEGQRLLKYKTVRGTKDFPEALFFILRDRCSGIKQYSFDEINTLLSELQINNEHHNEKVNEVIGSLVHDMDANQQKWLCRIILKDLHLGVSEKSLLCSLDTNAEAAYNVCSDLKKLCDNLGNLQKLFGDIRLGSVFKSMLADRVTDMNNIESLMKHKPFYVETKYDGERMQIHKSGDKYCYYSKGLKEYSHTYGENKSVGTLTPHIHDLIDAENCILDGEIIVFDTLNQVLFTKAQGLDARNLSGSSTTFLPCFVAFDIVYYNNNSLTTTIFSERRKILEKIVKEKIGYLYLSRQSMCSSHGEVLSELNAAIERNDEGLVLKIPESLYAPDQRVEGGWYKVKPDYLEMLNDTIDVIILGGYYGNNRGSGVLCHYLCGLYSGPGQYSSFCKVASGITADDLNTKLSKLTPHWIPFDKQNLPTGVILSRTCREKPAFVIDPNKSMVIEIRAAELMSTSFFALPITARFPRAVRIRDDKAPSDCTKFEELQRIQKINKRGISKVESDTSVLPKRKIQATSSGRSLKPHPSGIKDEIVVKGNELVGKVYCVLSSSASISKVDAERFIREHCGEIAATPIDGSIVVCGKQSISVQNVLKLQKHLIIDISWINLRKKKALPCPPHLTLFCPKHLKSDTFSSFDEFGDSYTEKVTPGELKELFKRVKESWPENSRTEINHAAFLDFKRRYFKDYWRFALKEYYILLESEEVTPLVELARLFGARVTSTLCPEVSHILILDKGSCFEDDVNSEIKMLTKENLVDLLKPYMLDDSKLLELL